MRPFPLQASHPHEPEQPIHLNSPRTTQLLPNLKPCTWNRLHMALALLLLLKRMSQAFHSSLLLLRLPQFLRSLPNQIFFLLPRPIFQIQATKAHPSRRTYMLHLDQPIVMLSDALQLAKSRSTLSGIGASTIHPSFRKGMDSRPKL